MPPLPAESTATPAPAESAPSDPASILEAALSDLAPPEDEPAEEPVAEEALVAPDAQQPDPKATAETAEVTDEDLTVDAKHPWTPERAKKLHERQLAREREIDGLFSRARKIEEKAKRKASEARSELERSSLVQKQLAAALAGLKGSGKEVLEALGRLTGRSGSEVYEEMSLDIAGARKADPKNAELAELKSLVTELKEELAAQKEQKTQASIEAAVRADIKRVVVDVESWPTIAALAASDPEASVADFEELYKAHCSQQGVWVDVEAFADRLERSLRKGAPAKPVSESGNRAVSANPGEATQRASAKTLTPSLAAVSGGSRRELTEHERTDELARDPDFLRSIGLPF